LTDAAGRPLHEEGLIDGVGREIAEQRAAAAELDALRRIATLVAERVQPRSLFAVVAEEVARIVGVPIVGIARYEPDGTATECASYSAEGPLRPLGRRWSFFDGMNVLRLVRETAKPARIDDYSQLEGEVADAVRRSGIRASAASPIIVEGHLWGVMVVSSRGRLRDGTERRLADFTELLAAAIVNAESRGALEQLVEEQVALRRVATLVAHGVAPAEIFTAVSDAVGHLFDLDDQPTDMAAVIRFDPGPEFVLVGAVKQSAGIPAGSRWGPNDRYVSTTVLRTGRSARIDENHVPALGQPASGDFRLQEYLSQVGSPIVVEGAVWGALTVNAQRPFPPDTEERLEKFTELVGTAVANAESRKALARLADEQSSLRHVATLVARGEPPDTIFLAVSEELRRLFETEVAAVGRFDPNVPALDVVGHGGVGQERWELEDWMATAKVLRSGRSERAEGVSWASAQGNSAERLRALGLVSTVASPIVVEDGLWGAMLLGSSRGRLPLDTEERLEKFTELVATAIANAESRSELTASRRRIVAASDEARRRIERDLHDGTQQRLISLAMAVRVAETRVGDGDEDLRASLSEVARGLADAANDLQELSRGIHPATLAHGGLGPALRELAHRSTIPAERDVAIDARLPAQVETAAYFVVSEALANAAKHARASRVAISAHVSDGRLRLSIDDDGIGGADPRRGSGLTGLSDRVQALGGSIRVRSRPGEGTQIVVELPL
jgi:signal transduction histidine kinase